MMDDAELLRLYGEKRDEAAFAELVDRHVDLVHSVALRQVNGDAHLAADVTQAVFSDLARKAAELASHRVLAGWLFTSTRFVAAKLVRGEQRRRAREQEAHLMEELTRDPAAGLDWQRVRPVLDDVLGELSETDREAILLRFFEGRDFASVGTKLNVNDNAARMRVERALDKLRGLLERRGVTSSTAALATVLANQAVIAAPAGLAATVTGAALASGAAAGAGIAAGAAGGGIWATFMSMTKLQVGIAGVLAVGTATGLALQIQDNAGLRKELAALRAENQQIAALRVENSRLAKTAAEAADYKSDDAALAQLRDESTALQGRLQKVARTEQARSAASFNGQVYDISTLDKAPQPTYQARPQFPFELRRAGVGGSVLVDFVVDSAGLVRNAKAVKSKLDASPIEGTGDPGAVVRLSTFTVAAQNPDGSSTVVQISTEDAQKQLEAAAVDAVTQWKFNAGRKGGREVNTHMQVPIVFTLSGAPKAPAK